MPGYKCAVRMCCKNENVQRKEKPLKSWFNVILLSFQNADAACGAQKLLESGFHVFKIRSSGD